MLQTIDNALSDIRAGFRLRHVWIALAHEDIGDQHRRTTLGPVWLLINFLLFVGIFVFLFNRGGNVPHYAAYASTGLVVWMFLSELMMQSVTLFVREESFIKGTRLPISVYIMRLVMQSTIREGYALIGCLGILLLSGIPFTPLWGWSVLGILIVLAASPAFITLFAFLGAYFPDSQFFVVNIVRVGMFCTPIFWVHGGEGGLRKIAYYWNPFTYFIEIVRTPIYSAEVPYHAMAVAGIITVCMWVVALLLLGGLRKQLVFEL